jgi:hypothetical protein
MAQQHYLNGAAINYINKPDWIDEGSPVLNGETVFNRWRRHTWRAEVMPVSEFNTVYALEGQTVSLTTTDYSDRNGDYVTYYGARVTNVTGRQSGPLMTDVTIEFLVRV